MRYDADPYADTEGDADFALIFTLAHPDEGWSLYRPAIRS